MDHKIVKTSSRKIRLITIHKNLEDGECSIEVDVSPKCKVDV